MCGIAGIISSNKLLVSKERITRMTNAIAHRGPDGEGCWINAAGNAGFGHRRLAIIDLSPDGAQPMSLSPGVSPTDVTGGRYSITYNGEIYNYLEIKQALLKKGYQFFTRSDTEVLLAAYDCWQQDCLQQLDGMFAFAIWDNQAEILFAARDRFGEKPFYYHEGNGQFIFGSEMKALWAAGVEKKSDEKMLLNYLALGYVQNANDKEQTFFQHIYSLPPSHYLVYSPGTPRALVTPYWKIDKEQTLRISLDGAIAQFSALFTKSVARRLRSDVPVGTSLSGGLDSSSIAATISQLKKGNSRLQTFSAVFPGFAKDESVYINTVVKKFRLQNHQVVPNAEDLVNDFPLLCHHQEEPFGSSSIYAQYKVFELAKKHQVKVILDGQGADETQAGYHHYIHWYLQQLVNRNSILTAIKEKKHFTKKNIPFTWGVKNILASFLPTHASLQLEKNEYRKLARHPDIHPDFFIGVRGREWEGIHKPIITKLNDILYFNTCTLGLEELLRFADRNSMAHGREVRLPFLHHGLVAFIFSLPAHFKIHEGYTKWLLRNAMKKRLPDTILWRTDKIGYEPPQQTWMQNDRLRELVHESKRKLVNNRVLKASALNKEILSLPAHNRDNFDWRYLCAAHML